MKAWQHFKTITHQLCDREPGGISRLLLQILRILHIMTSGITDNRRGVMKAWQHFKTITHHKILVMQGCFRVGLYRQGLTHDLSKYSLDPRPVQILPHRVPGGRKVLSGGSQPQQRRAGRHRLFHRMDAPQGAEQAPLRILDGSGSDHRTVRIPSHAQKLSGGDGDGPPGGLHDLSGRKLHRRFSVGILRRIPGAQPDAPGAGAPALELERQLSFLLQMLRDQGENETFHYIKFHVLRGDPFPWETE